MTYYWFSPFLSDIIIPRCWPIISGLSHAIWHWWEAWSSKHAKWFLRLMWRHFSRCQIIIAWTWIMDITRTLNGVFGWKTRVATKWYSFHCSRFWPKTFWYFFLENPNFESIVFDSLRYCQNRLLQFSLHLLPEWIDAQATGNWYCTLQDQDVDNSYKNVNKHIPNIRSIRGYFLHQNFFFTPKILLLLHQILKFRKKIWCQNGRP